MRPQFKPAKFLDPKTDVVFKKIFGNNPDLIKSFLNGVLPLDDDHLIESVEYISQEQSPRIPSMKNTIVDVKCVDQKGRIFIVEMQLNWTTNFKNRLLFGVSKAYVQQMQKGDNYESLCPVYGLGIINDSFDSSDEWFHHYKTINVKDSSKVLKGLELVFLELPKFKPQTLCHRKMGVLWLRFLKEINEKLVHVPEEFLQNPELSKAMELAQESSYTLPELEAYDKYWDAVQVEKTITHDARTEGRAQGRAEGLVEGIEIGTQKGIEMGKQAGLLTGAQKMLAIGHPVEEVARILELPVEEVQQFQLLE